MTEDTRERLRQSIDAIERAYEFFLAYAAQGLKRKPEGESRVASQLTEHLDGMSDALAELPGLVGTVVEQEEGAVSDALGPFARVLEADAEKAGVALGLVRAHEFASSQLVDNLNASVHVRALLTDLFLLDEALGLEPSEPPKPPKTKA